MLRLCLLIVALGAGIAAAWLAVSLRDQPVAAVVPAPVQPATQDVLVVSTELAQGERLTKENMRWQPWPESALNSAYVTRSARPAALDEFAGSTLRSRMAPGEPVQDGKLAGLNAGFLATVLPSGKRAVAVRISAENTAGGFILPSDRVDVIHTFAPQAQGEGAREHRSRTILKNVPVLAIDQTVDEAQKADKGKGKSVVIGKTATLELDSRQAEILAAAEAAGTLSLSLRSAADSNEVPTAATEERIQTVRVIRGGRSEVVKIQ
ncbi:Flp pilus assembly protein CpaB [Methylobacterium nodulans]|uniref:Flp pilus assembly protein CpaB n=1 Tax=Methylobacterium nodulans (strain LMG 21967 / CNCM I-2342 / ORS 2060) TaxID=460265 RepID=B8IRF4_METNO|nr:Flp pilus assembly protein CpaB [Methylobacterium nodulans]ACL58694.1 Flp pilus assembly protein CpaB [Methylobacterium nodulans ORS 2060]